MNHSARLGAHYVYVLRDPRYDGRPFYVGKGKGNRAQSHFLPSDSKYSPNRLKSAVILKIREAGLEPILDMLAKDMTDEDAISMERSLIKAYGRRDLGLGLLTNMTDGGEGVANRAYNSETARKITVALTGKPLSLEHRAALRRGAIQRVRNPCSEATKQKIRSKALGRKHSAEARLKMSQSQTKRTRKSLSVETKRKIGLAHAGRKRECLGGKKWRYVDQGQEPAPSK